MKRKSNFEFIKEVSIIHNDIYDYSLVNYKNNREKINIICKEHGVFKQTPYSHIKGSGCPKCKGNSKKNTYKFVGESKIKHGDKYDYSLVNYKNNKEKVIIICREHGEFRQSPSKHLSGNGCSKCGGSVNLSVGDFINKCLEKHGNKYDYSLSNYVNMKTKVDIICKEHGLFKQVPYNHIYGNNGCPSCKSSKGENKIYQYLNDNNIKFIKEFRIEEINMRFDFYIEDINLAIEYDGIQHFESIDFFGGDIELSKTKLRDSIKNKYCIDNNINLLRISYDKYDMIESILDSNLKVDL